MSYATSRSHAARRPGRAGGRPLGRRGAAGQGSELAELLGTTAGFVPQIIGPLVQRGWIRSDPGPTGGYWCLLTPPPTRCSVLDVIEAMRAAIRRAASWRSRSCQAGGPVRPACAVGARTQPPPRRLGRHPGDPGGRPRGRLDDPDDRSRLARCRPPGVQGGCAADRAPEAGRSRSNRRYWAS